VAIANFLVDTSASARIKNPLVADRLEPLIRAGLVATCPNLDAEALHSAAGPKDYEMIRANRRASYEYIPVEDRHWRLALDVQRALVRSGRHRSVGIVDLLTSVIAAENRLEVLHYDADFETAAEILSFEHDWVAPRGSIP
jgi:predicted nucleic acid-binding protein